MTIEIRQEQQGEVRILALSGRLDTETSADLELALQDLQADGATHFVIDLADIGYVSSAGLRVLLALAKQLDGGRGSLKLCALNEAVRQVFDVAGFSRMFAIFPNRDAALASAAAAVAAAPAAKPAPAAAPPARAAAAAIAPKPAPAPAVPTKPAAPPEVELARRAADLLGAGESSRDAAPGSAELARAAAALLGGAAKSRSSSADKSRAAEPAPAPPGAKKTEPDDAPAGVLGKFRNLFGNKK
jgi:anti-anti-sigma factor